MTYVHRRSGNTIFAAVTGALALLLLLVPLAAPAGADRNLPNNACGADTPQSDYEDRVEAIAVHHRSIDCISALGVTRGHGEDGDFYLPAALVRRDQMASFVARTLEATSHELPAPQDQGFDDIEGNVHEDRINQLAQVGVVQGNEAGDYEPDEVVTRAQMATYIMRAAEEAHDAQYAPVAGPYFSDAQSGVHQPNIDVAFEQWLVAGTGSGEYDPELGVRRDQMATFLTRLADLVHPGQFQNSNQTYIVAPQEAITQTAGEPFDFSVSARYDGQPFDGSVDVTLLPCANAEPTELPVTFADENDDGLADDVASTDTGQAYISEVNGSPTMGPELQLDDVSPDDQGTLAFTVVSPQADCAVITVFADGPPQDQLRLDAGQRPSGPFGVGKITWE